MQSKGNERWTNHIDFLLIDIIALIVSFIASYRYKFGDFGFISSDVWMPLLYIVTLLNVVICLFSNTYNDIFRRAYYEEIIHSILLTLYNLTASSVIFYVFKIGTVFSRQMILTMYILYFLISLVFKCIWKKLILSKKIGIYKPKKISLLVLSERDNAEDVIRNAVASDFEAYEIHGLCLTGKCADKVIGNVPVVCSVEEMAEYAISNGIDEVLVAVNPATIDKTLYTRLVSNNIGIHFSVESVLGFQSEDYEISDVGVHKTLSVGTYTFTAGQSFYLIVKRVLDIIFGLIGIIVLIPVSVLVKLIYLVCGDTARIFYTQKRVGKNGKDIRIFKFRTMVPDADKRLAELLKDDKYRTEWETNQKFANDPRITKAGRILRKTSIDELPQLINVLKGDMSLVGPRPLVIGELEAHNGMKLYQNVKPGITGWWGCNGRSNIEYRERLELEYYYVKHISIYLDFLCVLRTVLSVLKRDGAE